MKIIPLKINQFQLTPYSANTKVQVLAKDVFIKSVPSPINFKWLDSEIRRAHILEKAEAILFETYDAESFISHPKTLELLEQVGKDVQSLFMEQKDGYVGFNSEEGQEIMFHYSGNEQLIDFDAVTVTRKDGNVKAVTKFEDSGKISVVRTYIENGREVQDVLEGTLGGEISGQMKKYQNTQTLAPSPRLFPKVATYGICKNKDGLQNIDERFIFHDNAEVVKSYEQGLCETPDVKKCRRVFEFLEDGTLMSCLENVEKSDGTYKCSDKFVYLKNKLDMYFGKYDSKDDSKESCYASWSGWIN